jgi:purine-nucleoside phosphorylase
VIEPNRWIGRWRGASLARDKCVRASLYLPPSDYSTADERLGRLAEQSLAAACMSVQVGATWTTDAPFRETSDAITAAQEAGMLAVEMEAAALYAFAVARNQPVLCFAHVTNQRGVSTETSRKALPMARRNH